MTTLRLGLILLSETIGSSVHASLVKTYSVRSSIFELRQVWFLKGNLSCCASRLFWFISLFLSLDYFCPLEPPSDLLWGCLNLF